MPAPNRSGGRNVHIFDVNDSATVLGGLILTDGITNANFYSIVDIVYIFNSQYFLRDESGTTIQRDGHLLHPGRYYIVTSGKFLARLHDQAVAEREYLGSISLNNEPWLVRTTSQITGARIAAFRDAVRERDGRCVITGEVAIDAEFGDWDGFEAAHVFPLAYKGHWGDYNYGRWITIPAATGSSINSVQNGILLESAIYQRFDSYRVSINPDDHHKIVCFGRDGKGIAGKHLDQRFLEDPRRPPDSLLRWHYRQAVLANVRGAGEPIFEFDFPPGSDIMGEIVSGPRAGDRMEFELFSRLAE